MRPFRLRSLSLAAALLGGPLLLAPLYSAQAATVASDENGPQVQIFAPGSQDVLQGMQRILVGVTARQYNPSTIELLVDDRSITGALPLSSLSSQSFNWKTHLFTDGPHKLTVIVTDAQGFRGVQEVSVSIRNGAKGTGGSNSATNPAPSKLGWKSLKGFDQLSGETTVELDAPTGVGVKWIIVKATPKDPNNRSAQPSWLLGNGALKFKFQTNKVADGLYTLSAEAWDALEQKVNAPSLTVGVVNSPINATTVQESLDALRAQDEAANPKKGALQSTQRFSAQATPAPSSTKVHSGELSAAPPRSGEASAQTPNYTPRVASPSFGAKPSTPRTRPTYGASQTLAPAFVPRTNSTSTAPHSSVGGATREANSGVSAELNTPPALSQPKSREGAVTGVASTTLSGAPTPTFLARAAMPGAGERAVETEGAFSPGEATAAGALSPARSPLAEAKVSDRLEIARLTLPKDEEHSTDSASLLDVAPVLSSTKVLGETVSPVSQAIALSTPARTCPTLVASAPVHESARVVPVAQVAPAQTVAPSRMSKGRGPSKTVVSPRANQRQAPAPMETPRVAADGTLDVQTPQLSERHDAPESVVASRTPVPSKIAKIVPRIATRLRPERSQTMRSVVGSDKSPAITVSPIRTALSADVPKSFLVERDMELREVADQFGLSVEMVAAANNWTSNMRVIPGMVVLLPRRVKISYNGAKVEGDVPSMIVGDTTMTAMRFLFEKSGGTLEWKADTQEVIARKGASVIHVKIGSKVATVGNKQVMMQLAAFLFEGRTMVPARLFEEGLHAQVEYDPQTGHIVVAMLG